MAHRLVAEEEILGDSQLRHQGEFLKHCGDAAGAGSTDIGEDDAIAAEPHFATGRLIGAGQDRDQRRFPGAVLAEERMHFAGAEFEIDIDQGIDARIMLRQSPGLQQGHSGTARASSTGTHLHRVFSARDHSAIRP